MSEKARRIPFPCHPKRCWMLTGKEASRRVYQQCGVCGELYEIDTVSGAMQHMVPEQQPSQRAQLLFNKVNRLLSGGYDVVLRRTSDGEIKVVGQSGFNDGKV